MAFNTTNLDLRVWNLLNDNFNHTDLAANWSKLDIHNHVPHAQGGDGGVPIPEDGIAPNAITNGKLATNAVDSRVVATDAITAIELSKSASDDSLRAVSTDHIKDANVTLAKLAVFPTARLSEVASQTISSVAATKLALGTVEFAESVNASTTDSRLTAEVEGIYLVTAAWTWDGVTSPSLQTPYRSLYVKKDGGATVVESSAHILTSSGGSVKQAMNLSYVGQFSIGQYVELWAVANGGTYSGTRAALTLSLLSHL